MEGKEGREKGREVRESDEEKEKKKQANEQASKQASNQELAMGSHDIGKDRVHGERRLTFQVPDRDRGIKMHTHMHIYISILNSAIPCERRLTFLVPDRG